MTNFTVRILDEDREETFEETFLSDGSPMDGSSFAIEDIEAGGRYVRISIPEQYLSLAEVQVFGLVFDGDLGFNRQLRTDVGEEMLGRNASAFLRMPFDAENPEALVQVGTTADGTPALLNRHIVEADLRIVTGFIEPHFFAGFSGGVKGIMPGCAGLETVMSNHGAKNIGDPRATFGVTDGNPLWEELRDIALKTGPSFVLNVTLNEQRDITNVFAGDILEAHRAGCAFVKRSAMQPVEQPFDIVVTTNSGYPLDLNLYQGVKGMSAGARVLKEGGTLILAAECREGVPGGSPLDELLRSAGSTEEILAKLSMPGFVRPEQWQAQIQALVQRKAEVLVHSLLDEKTVAACHLKSCPDISAEVASRLNAEGPETRLAVLPQGPLTIPYLA